MVTVSTEREREREREREIVLSFGIWIHEKKIEKGSDHGKGTRLPIPNIPGEKLELYG